MAGSSAWAPRTSPPFRRTASSDQDKLVLGAPENAASTTLLIKAWLELYGWEFVQKLKANNTAETRLQTEAIQAVARGEKQVTVVAQAFAYLLLGQKAPLAVVWPGDGVVRAEMTMFIPRKAPHPSAARMLANHLISAGYQAAAFPKAGAYSAVTGVASPDLFPPLASLKIHPTRLDELLAQRGELLDRWRARSVKAFTLRREGAKQPPGTRPGSAGR